MRRALFLALLVCSGCYESSRANEPPDAGEAEDAAPPHDASSMEDASGVADASPPDGGPSGCDGPGARFITRVVEHEFGTGQDHNQERGFPEVLYGPPRANDASSVVSLGNGGFVVVEFEGNAIVDGPGPDFIVFENPLPRFVELATVSVSDDLITWYEFPCTAQQAGPDYGFCAGVGIVNAHPENGVDPLDPAAAGGDAFDLADIGVASARYVRVQDREDLTGPAGVFDLDAIAIVNARCP